MSRILALDTSADACSVALVCDGVVTELFSDVPREHTRRLLPMVERILAEHQLSLAQLDAIAFGRGPGSFTGLRICLGVVQGLAFGADLPVIPVSTLEAMAYGAWRRQPALTGTILAALDARMDEVYWAEYEVHESGVTAVTAEYVMPPASVIEQLPIGFTGSRMGIGSGWHYPDMSAVPVSSVDVQACVHAEDIARLGDVYWQKGAVVTALEAQPVYLRDSVAWKKRERIRPVLE